MTTARPRVAFAGTPDFAVPSLRALAAAGAEIPVVMTQPDRPAGRGRHMKPSAVKAAAQALAVPVLQPAALSRDLRAALGEPPDLMIVAAYGLLLPPWLLEWPRQGCVNLHASLLPRWRGAAPIQRAILAGDSATGISVMRMEEGLDTGPVYLQRTLAIGARETAGELHDRLAGLAAEALADILPDLLAGRRRAEPQQNDLATHAAKLSKAEAPLDWSRPAVHLARQVRAFDPWPVAEARLDDGRRLRVLAADALAAAAPRAEPGTIVAAGRAGIDVATGDGVLRLARVQPASGRVMDAGAYLAAHSLQGAAFVA